MTTDLLTVTNLTKRYADYQLANVSFSLPAGYIMGFIGPNGAGKTTTIKAILDMIKPDSGNISVLGQTTPQARETIRDQLGIVLDGAVYPDSWPAEAVNRYVGPFFPNWDTAYFQQLLRDFDIPTKPKYHDLSMGTKIKLQLAAALAHHPKLLILDEPTSGLDPIARDELIAILQDFIRDEQHSVLISTHSIMELAKVADYVTYLLAGKITFTSPLSDLLDRYLLIKGGPNDLTAAIKATLIGLQESPVGFSGVWPADQAAMLPDNMIQEPVDLETLMIAFGEGGHPHA